MPTATVLVQGKSEPERGKKRGRIKSDSGMVFQADPIFLKQVNVGSTYEFDYRDDSFARDDGEVIKFRVIEKIRGGELNVPPPAPMTSARPAASQYVPTTKDEDIATLAIAKEQLSKINPGDIEMGLHVLKSSAMMWRKFKD